MIILKYVIIICREGGVHMFAKDVLRILQVSRPTLTKYVKIGIIRVHVMPNGHYDYNEEEVYKFLKKDVKRKIKKFRGYREPVALLLYEAVFQSQKAAEDQGGDSG